MIHSIRFVFFILVTVNLKILKKIERKISFMSKKTKFFNCIIKTRIKNDLKLCKSKHMYN